MLKMRRLDRMQMSSPSVRRPPVGLPSMNSVLGRPDLNQRYNVIPDLSAARRRFEVDDGEEDYDPGFHVMHDRRQGEFSPMIPRQMGGMSPQRSFHGLQGPHGVMSLRNDDAGMYGPHTAAPFRSDIAGLHGVQSDMIYRNDLDEMYDTYGPMAFRTDVPGFHGFPSDVPFRNDPSGLHGARSAMPLRSDIPGLQTAQSDIPYRSDVGGLYGPYGGMSHMSEITDPYGVYSAGIPRSDDTGILRSLRGNAAVVHGIQSAKPKKKKAPKTKRGGKKDDNGNVVRGKIQHAFDIRESAPSIGQNLSLYGKSSVLPGIGPKSPVGFGRLRTESEINTPENRKPVENVGEKSILNQFKGFGTNTNVIPAIKPSMQTVRSTDYTSSHSYKALDDGTAVPMTCIDKTVLAGKDRGLSLYGKNTSSVLPGITPKNDDIPDGLIQRKQSTYATNAHCMDGTNNELVKQDEKEPKELGVKLRPNIDGLEDLQNTSHIEYESSDHETKSEPNKECVTGGSIQQFEEKSNSMPNDAGPNKRCTSDSKADIGPKECGEDNKIEHIGSSEPTQTDKMSESKCISSCKSVIDGVGEKADNVKQHTLEINTDLVPKGSSNDTIKEKDDDKPTHIIKECFVATTPSDVNVKQENKLDEVDVTKRQRDTQCTDEVETKTDTNKLDAPTIEVEKESKDETNDQNHGIESPDNSQPQTKVLSTEVAVSKANVIVINPDSVKRQHRKKRIARESTKLAKDVKSVEVLRKSEEDNSSEEKTSNADEDIDHSAEENLDNDGEYKQGLSVLERKITTNVFCSHPSKSAKSKPDGEINTSTDKREICIHVPIQNGDFEINVKCTAIKKRDDNKSNGIKQHVFTFENDEKLTNSEKNETYTDLKQKRLSKKLMVNDKENENSKIFSKRLTSSSEMQNETSKNFDDGRIDYVHIENMIKELEEPQKKKFIADFVTWYMKPFYDNPSQFGTMCHNLMKIREENPEIDVIKLIQDPTSPDADPVLCGLVRRRSMKKETEQSSSTPVVDNKGLTAVADDKGPGWVVDNKDVFANTSGMKIDNKYPNQATDKKYLDKLDNNIGQMSEEPNKAIGNIDAMSNAKVNGKCKRSEPKQTEISELTKSYKTAHERYLAIVKRMNALYDRERERIRRKRERRADRSNKRNDVEVESMKNQKTDGIRSFFRKFICICKPKDVTYDM